MNTAKRIVIAAIISALVFAFLPSCGRSSTGRQRPEDDENASSIWRRDDQDDKDGIGEPGNGSKPGYDNEAPDAADENDSGDINDAGDESDADEAADPIDEFIPDYKDASEINEIGTNAIDHFFWGTSIVKQGGWIYYSFSGKGIYKMPVNGSPDQIVKLTSDSLAYQIRINVVGDWVYYLLDCPEVFTDKLIRLRTDGKVKEIVAENVGDFIVIRDYIYYLEYVRLDASTVASTIKMLSVNGGESETLIAEGGIKAANKHQLQIIDENGYHFIYDLENKSMTRINFPEDIYSFSGKICEIPGTMMASVEFGPYEIADYYFVADTQDWRGFLIVEDGGIYTPAIHDYWAYYPKDGEGLFRRNLLSPDEEQKICNDYKVFDVVVPGDGWVYYKLQNTGRYCRIKPDGTGWEKIDYFEPSLTPLDEVYGVE